MLFKHSSDFIISAAVISSSVDTTTKLELWSGSHRKVLIAQEAGGKNERIQFLIGKYFRRGWSQGLCLNKGA